MVWQSSSLLVIRYYRLLTVERREEGRRRRMKSHSSAEIVQPGLSVGLAGNIIMSLPAPCGGRVEIPLVRSGASLLPGSKQETPPPPARHTWTAREGKKPLLGSLGTHPSQGTEGGLGGPVHKPQTSPPLLPPEEAADAFSQSTSNSSGKDSHPLPFENLLLTPTARD